MERLPSPCDCRAAVLYVNRAVNASPELDALFHRDLAGHECESCFGLQLTPTAEEVIGTILRARKLVDHRLRQAPYGSKAEPKSEWQIVSQWHSRGHVRPPYARR